MNWTTHQVANQVPDLQDINLYAIDTALREAVAREGGAWHAAALERYGALAGSAEVLELGARANRNRPVFQPFDRHGRRVDRVEFDPAWQQLMGMLWAEGVHCSAWSAPRPGAHVARAAAFYLHGQAEAGTLCPATMSFAAIPLLAAEPALFLQLRAKLFSRRYDGRDLPVADKQAMLVGMGLTEKQGGSDLRSNTTLARPLAVGRPGGEYHLTGHKWFYSVPTSDAHLVLARDGERLSCFYVPRWQPDGTRNAVRIQRLKDKLGNLSNASAEVEFQDAWGLLVGEEGRGLAALIGMASHTRLDCVLGSAALLRQALVQALHHARHRAAFGRRLVEHALMQSVLADLALESEAATVLALRLARACDEQDDALSRALFRLVTPAAKFWVCKRAIAAVAECMEVLGGNGYVEDHPLARLYREAPVNSIWEGAGNIMCLDVLRGIAREPASTDALLSFLADGCAGEPALTGALAHLNRLLRAGPVLEAAARDLATHVALLVQAVLLRRAGPQFVADAFIASRFDVTGGRVFGQSSAPAEAAAIMERAYPA